MGKNVQKKTIHAKKRPKTLKNAIFSFATPKSKSTQQRRRKARATQAEVLVSKAFIALRKEYPHRKSFGRRVVYQRVKGKGVSMKSIQRLLSKKGGRVFPGRARPVSESTLRYARYIAGIRETQGNEGVMALSQNSCSRISRKASYT